MGSQAGLELGSLPIRHFAVGTEYAPADTKTAGHLYIDDVSTSSARLGPTVSGGRSHCRPAYCITRHAGLV